MNREPRVLFVGESWFVHTMESKGFDSFTFDRYETGITYIKPALEGKGIAFTHLPSHLVEYEFPATARELRDLYDVILISDVGANTFLMPMKTFLQEETTPNKLEIMKEFVQMGGGLAMIGGYLTFMGIEGKGKYKGTVMEEILPVTLQSGDDRCEIPQGLTVEITQPGHPVFAGVPQNWPALLGYNKLTAKPEAQVLAVYEGDCFLALGGSGKGRTAAFAGDCAPHWMPKAFCTWEGYAVFWSNLVNWLAGK